MTLKPLPHGLSFTEAGYGVPGGGETPALAPVNTVAPTIGGDAPIVGGVLTGGLGTWENAQALSRQWLRGTTAIPGATASAYMLVQDDVGFSIRQRVIATNGDQVVTADTAPIGPVQALDTTPDVFGFEDVTDAALDQVITSNAITVAGINGPANISIEGGTFSKNGGPYSATARTVVADDQVRIRVISAATNSAAVNATLTIGGVADTFTVTTAALPADATPEAFTFVDVTGATTSTAYESNAVTVAGINTAANLSINGGEYQVNGGAWASAARTVVAGDVVKVRATSSAEGATAVNVVLTIGGVADTYTITTQAMGGGEQVTNIPAHANLREAFGIYNLKPGSGVFSGRVATVCAPGAPEPPTSVVDVFLDGTGAPDLAPAASAFGSELSFYQFHSQSGSGAVAQAVNAGGRLRLFVGEEFKQNGKYVLYAVTGANYRVATGEYQRQSLSFVEMVGGNMQGGNANSTSSLGANPQTLASSVSFLSEATGRGALGSSFVRSAGVYHGYHPEVATFVSSASSTKIRSGHRRDTLGTNTAATMAGITLGAGYYAADSKFYQGWLVYDAALSDADELAVATAMSTIHGTNLNVPSEILFERGDSITYDQGPPLPLHDGASARLARDRPQTKVVNAGVPGAVMADFPPAWFAARRVVGAKNVLKLGFGSNNWASASAPANDPQAVFGTDDVTPGTFRYAIANAKAAGVVPVVRTTIMRPAYTTTQAERRAAFNQLLRDNAAALEFLLVDFGDTVFPTVDNVHPTAAGYAAMYAVEGPVIAQAFSIAQIAA
ncbi:MAG: SGNH/GDSL hydrolase family protein [Brevundimonas sp.]|uniref:SGNH/GDSL hydrolase family protein n=1 Tax=Brevundimonas sp. TaxID=1871086 RepID=UPI00271FDBA4|nr:SGNH/GDSL hydrolase family protein [Brevundimonas sp.]MDO9607225.1 SGNH/GDSL hydrolase family protein [Brevundimonas sp.]